MDRGTCAQRSPQSSPSVIVLQLETFAFVSGGGKGIAPWDAPDAFCWTLEIYVRSEQRGGHGGEVRERSGKTAGNGWDRVVGERGNERKSPIGVGDGKHQQSV